MVGEVSERMGVSRSSALPEDLRPRVVSGLVLAALALGSNWAGAQVFAVLVGLIAAVMSWEWGNVVRGPAMDLRAIVHAALVVGAAALTAVGQLALAGMLLAAGMLIVALIRPDRTALMSALGVAYVGVPVIALIWLRSSDAGAASTTVAASGAAAIVFLFVIVWTTDTFSYVCGKLIGGPRLWPALSPAKTWAGTLGGVVFAGAAGLVFAYITGHGAPLLLGLTGLGLGIAAQLGDLAESGLKRAHGVKHVSQLIPGHGGFMDRMDGVVAAAMAAGLAAVLVNGAHPARALLYWF